MKKTMKVQYCYSLSSFNDKGVKEFIKISNPTPEQCTKFFSYLATTLAHIAPRREFLGEETLTYKEFKDGTSIGKFPSEKEFKNLYVFDGLAILWAVLDGYITVYRVVQPDIPTDKNTPAFLKRQAD
jgi:hypothetical protein